MLKSNTLAHGVHRFKIDFRPDSHRITAPVMNEFGHSEDYQFQRASIMLVLEFHSFLLIHMRLVPSLLATRVSNNLDFKITGQIARPPRSQDYDPGEA